VVLDPFRDLTYATSAALIVAMAIALVQAWPGRHRSPHWLLALASFAGAVGSVQLMTSLVRQVPPGFVTYAGVTAILDLVSVGLAVICAVAGLLTLRRLPGPAGPA
jgi:hypothetical protein